MPVAATTSVDVDGFLAQACEQSLAVELSHQRQGHVSRCRARLVRLGRATVLTDTPLYDQNARRLPVRVPVTGVVQRDDSRYEFDTVIESDAIIVSLNSERRVRGLELRRPTIVRRSQRRAAFRVSLAGGEPVPVTLVECAPVEHPACSLSVRPVGGRLVNLSVGGAAVLVPRRLVLHAQHGQRYFTSFLLPSAEREFLLETSVRHVAAVEASSALRMGMTFVGWGVEDMRTESARLARALAALQQLQLRQRKR